jgi:hypothetical protein
MSDPLQLVFEFLTAVIMKSTIFWDMMLSSLLHASCVLGLIFGLEGGGSSFLRNVIELVPDYTASHVQIC